MQCFDRPTGRLPANSIAVQQIGSGQVAVVAHIHDGWVWALLCTSPLAPREPSLSTMLCQENMHKLHHHTSWETRQELFQAHPQAAAEAAAMAHLIVASSGAWNPSKSTASSSCSLAGAADAAALPGRDGGGRGASSDGCIALADGTACNKKQAALRCS